MQKTGRILEILLLICSLTGPSLVAAQCMTNLEFMDSSDFKYVGLYPTGERGWAGQQFPTDCDGQFLTVEFQVSIDPFSFNGVPVLGVGQPLHCTILDDQLQAIATVAVPSPASFGLHWVAFDFAPLELGLAAGTLHAILETPEDAYIWMTSGNDAELGMLVTAFDGAVSYGATKDAAFRVTWDPEAVIVATELRSWGGIKSLYR